MKIKNEEMLSFELEMLYSTYGYRKAKMRRFEEYSMYMSYSDFLSSKGVITFTGLDGKLLALRPDVTLSIVKNTKASNVNTEKLFYNEKVYRQTGKSKEYKEISQTGVELIGKVDLYAYVEILTLALKSLEKVSDKYVLDISDIKVVTAVIESFNLTKELKKQTYKLLRAKNYDDFLKLAKENDLSEKEVLAFETLCNLSGVITEEEIKPLMLNEKCKCAVEYFIKLLSIFKGSVYQDKINVNFSIEGNAIYYNGAIFNGYIENIPKLVLSGGRYDRLLEKFGREVGAIGFAVYLGEIERFIESETVYTDILIVYSEKIEPTLLIEKINEYMSKGLSVRADSSIPKNFAYKKLIKLNEKGEEIC
jgi:ATP phosphoribosyltransferase regulatory subunit